MLDGMTFIPMIAGAVMVTAALWVGHRRHVDAIEQLNDDVRAYFEAQPAHPGYGESHLSSTDECAGATPRPQGSADPDGVVDAYLDLVQHLVRTAREAAGTR